MKVLKVVLITLGVLLVIVAVLGLVAPKEFQLERTVSIQAPAQLVLDYASDLEKFEQWSPWSELDHNMQTRFTGNPGEIGSTFEWEGNKEVGKGKMEVMAISDNRIDIQLTFLEPYASTANSYFNIQPDGENNLLSWGFKSEMSFPFNLLGLFMNMEENIGPHYDKGLSQLKGIVELVATQQREGLYNGYQITEMLMEPKTYVINRRTVAFEDVETFYSESFSQILDVVGKSKVKPAGSPSGLFYMWDEVQQVADLAAAIPVDGQNTTVSGYETVHLEGGRTLVVDYIGPYDQSGNAHYAIDNYMRDRNLHISGPVIEEYIINPGNESDPAKWHSKIIYPVQ